MAGIGSALGAAHTAAATRTRTLLPAAADEVSAGIAQLFSQHADDYQKLAGQAAAFHGQFMQQLTASASSYASADAANASLLQPKTATAAAAAGAGITWLDQMSTAINSYIDSLLNRIALLFLWPFWIPIALSYLPLYILLSAFFPEAFPLTDFWKIFFLPFF
ncbi:PE family protein [Mycobacterium riyadhense]|uniref:PE family protein n=1 Tax=Mycobacterium riyadhense TaxID=486698 RepID=UPI001951385B|nr:PE family protein [Mycobacterium riyadhense]